MKKHKRLLFNIFKVIIIGLSYVYIVNKLHDIEFGSLLSFSENGIVIILIVLILMIINWSIEALKWQYLVKNIQEITFSDAIKNVTVGVVMGLFTPNRVGEIGGKAVYLKKNNKLKGAFAASLGSLAQLTVTVVLGILGLSLLFVIGKSLNIKHPEILGVIFIFVALVLLLLFFNVKTIIDFLTRKNIFPKLISKAYFLREYSKSKLLIVLILSLFRYVVFVLQFYLLLLFFNVQIEFFVAIAGIFIVYLFMNIMPNVVFADLGIRGSVSMFVLGQFATNIQGILAASVLLWMINILIPAMIGQVYLFRTKLSAIAD